jgi:cytosolic carboxypeptidase protein 2/3
MRVDSNTKGHTCWFFFKVSNYLDRQRVKFNIVNFSRSELLYGSGMKPYVYCSSTKEWVQEGQNIEFYPTRRAKYIDYSDMDEENQLHTLGFEYQFKIEDEFVYFAYCIPYSYSYLLFIIAEMEKKHFKILDIDRNNLSTGGLALPIITITNKNSNLINI